MPNTRSQLRQILEDLYQHDPELRAKESELIPLIEQILALRPTEEPSEQFVAELQKRILATHAELYPSHSSPSFLTRMSSVFQFKYLAIPVGLFAIAAVAITTLPNLRTNTLSPTKNTPALFTAGTISQNAARQAFGSLASAFQPGSMGAGGGSGVAATTNPAMGASDKRMATSIMAPYDLTNYKYVYNGELPTWEDQVPVYKRLKGSSQDGSLIQALARSTSGLVDLTKLRGLELHSFTLNQAVAYGYNVTVDLAESVINISQNYSQWPHPEALCKDDACYQRLRLAEGDVLPDAELIQIANDFLKEQGIATDKYAAPQVNSDWRRGYAETQDKAGYYIPESLTVVYPVKVNDQIAYDEGGMAHGLMVNVNMKSKRVDNVSNLTTNNFESSSYEAEKDSARIRAVMEKGGVYGYLYPEAKKTVEVELQNPEIILQKVWLTREAGKPMDELLIPSLRFEVKNAPENSYLSKYIFVPLVKEVLDQQRGDIRIY